MIPGLKEVCFVRSVSSANACLAEGWELLTVNVDPIEIGGIWFFGKAEGEVDWTLEAVHFLNQLDPGEIDRVLLEAEGLEGDMDTPSSGTAAVLEFLKRALAGGG